MRSLVRTSKATATGGTHDIDDAGDFGGDGDVVK